MVEIDWQTLKLYDLSKARIKVEMKVHTILLALIEVEDGKRVFTISIAIAKDNKERHVGQGELTRERNESSSSTSGRLLSISENQSGYCVKFQGGQRL